jgi:hypothetical protein
MTVKPLDIQTLSIRAQSDADKILLKNLNDIYLSGKKPFIELRNDNDNVDLILKIRSEK